MRGHRDGDRGFLPWGTVRFRQRGMPFFQHGRGAKRKQGPVRPALPETVPAGRTGRRLAQPPGPVPAGPDSGAGGRGRRQSEDRRPAEKTGICICRDEQLPEGSGPDGGGLLPAHGRGGAGKPAADFPPGRLHAGLCLRSGGRGGHPARRGQSSGDPAGPGHGGKPGRIRPGAAGEGTARRGRPAAAARRTGKGNDLRGKAGASGGNGSAAPAGRPPGLAGRRSGPTDRRRAAGRGTDGSAPENSGGHEAGSQAGK